MADEHVILLPRAYYSAPVAVFLASMPETILGCLTANSEMAVEPPQRDAWLQEIAVLKNSLQDLELDWVCVNWDADLRFTPSGWAYHIFRGDRWCGLHKDDRRNYLRNAYRVLLTRARQGMVIFVPPGEENDPTRTPAFYDRTFQYLAGLGIPVLDRHLP